MSRLVVPTPEFSRPHNLAQLPRAGLVVSLSANAAELAALATRLGLLSFSSFTAALELQPQLASESVVLSGHWSAELAQECVVTLEPVPQKLLRQPLRVLLVPPSLAVPEDELDDGFEPIDSEGNVDLGELLVQHLAVTLDPYPRLPGASFAGAGAAEPARKQPFADLVSLRTKLTKTDKS